MLVQVNPVGVDVTVYAVTGVPPVVAGAAQLMVASEFPATALGVPGTVGGVTTVTGVDGVEGDEKEVNPKIRAETVKVYVPCLRPVTVHEVVVEKDVQVLCVGVEVTTYC